MAVPFFSIIIPVYNVEIYLKECLDSISQITAFTWEAIMVDDGSTDSSSAICDEYAQRDNRFRVIHQHNAGVAAARNTGLKVAQGEWIWFVDGDDTINPDFVIDNVELMKDVDYVMFDLQTFDDGNSPCAISNIQHCIVKAADDKNEFLVRNRCNHHQRLFYKKSLMMNDFHTRLFFTKGIRVGEDLEFQYKYLTLCQRPARMTGVLYNYRLRKGSATQDGAYRNKTIEDVPKVLENILVWIKGKPEVAYVDTYESWLEVRMAQMFQNLLYSASLVNTLDKKQFQQRVRELLSAFRMEGFRFANSIKMKLAFASISIYFILNRIYLRIKGL